MPEREAMFYAVAGERTDCELCPWHCHIGPDRTGRCTVRRNTRGVLHTLNYAEVTSLALDPIEKKPLYHFKPGSTILSLGSFGCNLSCGFCQNWQLSQERAPSRTIPPAQAVQLAVEQVPAGNVGIAYTYNEPFVWYEYVRETAPLVQQAGLCNVLVTNGIIETQPLEELLPFIEAMNVDIKSMSERFYLQHCKGQALPARQTVERVFGRCHVELTNLLIPGENDSEEDLRALVDWAASVSPDLVLHFSAYHPDYEFATPATPPETLRRAYELAKQKLRHVYVGNIDLPGTRDTECAGCGRLLVSRQGRRGKVVGLSNEGRCAGCGANTDIRL